MIWLATFKIILMLGPVIYIFYKDKQLWNDSGCSIIGGPDLVYKD